MPNKPSLYDTHKFLIEHGYGHLNLLGVQNWGRELDQRIADMRERYPKDPYPFEDYGLGPTQPPIGPDKK